MDIAGENCAVGAILHLNAVGGDVDRSIAVVALERRHGLLLADLADGRSSGKSCGREADCKDGAKVTHGLHLTPPCTIFKRAPPSSTTVRLPRSALSCPAWKSPRRIWPATGPELASLRCFKSTSTSRVAKRYPSAPVTRT